MTYFDKNGVVVRKSKFTDIDFLAKNMRSSDRIEIWDSHHATPLEALHGGYASSVLCMTIEKNKNLIGMVGINPSTLTGDKAIIWLLGSNELNTIKRCLVKNSRMFIDIFLDTYSYLENWISADSKNSILWLKSLGAKIEKPMPFGYEGTPFCHFIFQRSK